MGANLYISVADYKALYGITDASHDAVLDAIIEAASRRIDKFCGRIFYSGAAVEYFDGNGEVRYFTLHRPIISVSELARVSYDSTGTVQVDELLAGNEYHVYEQHVELSQWTTSGVFGGGMVFVQGQRNFRLTYAYGTADVPEDVAMAAAMLANYLLSGNSTLKVGGAYISERIGDYSYDLGGVDAQMQTLGMPPDVKAILSGYRKPRIGGLGGG